MPSCAVVAVGGLGSLFEDRRARSFPTGRTTTPPPVAGDRPLVGHGVFSCGTKSSVLIRASSSGSRVKCRFCGTTPCCSARTAFISPNAPAADWACPKLVLTEPRAHRAVDAVDLRPGWRTRSGRRPGYRCRGPPPCRRCAASTPAAASAARYTATCASRDGVAMLTVWPSWLAAVPRTTARIRSPSRSASGNRLSNTIAAALAGHEPVSSDVKRVAASGR